MAPAFSRNEQAIDGAEQALLVNALFGAGLPEAAERHLDQAARLYHRAELAEQHLREAQILAPDHAAVLIGLYRFFFYKGRLEEALDVACTCLGKAARDNNLAADWHCVRPGDADFSNFGASLPRFYLFTLKAYAYLQMRLGDTDEGHAAVQKLLELDPSDKVNAGVLLGVWQRIGQADDD
jgi:tetratricopeptide (TPR) repeat protein